MRRFNWGATQRPQYNRPGVPFGQCTYGAPGPTKEVHLNHPLVPEMFTENSSDPIQKTYFVDEHVMAGATQSNTPNAERVVSKTIIDLTNND